MLEHRSFRQEPLEALTDQIADPEHHSGGGTVAAVSASLAGSLTAMIGRLSLNRRANQPSREEIDSTIGEINQLIATLQDHADSDAEVLVDLLAAYRDRRTDQGKYLDQLNRAARSTLALSADVHRLLLLIERLLPYATRFTVSDLGAAAAISQGALTAALLTVDVNVRLIREKAGEEAEVAELARQLDELQSSGSAIARRIEARSRAALAGDSR